MPGCLLIIGMFLLILWRGLKLASRFAEYPFLCALTTGLTCLLVLPAMLNMGVVTGLLPTKGLVLPLIAYGGTAMVINLMICGILIGLSRWAD